jgi:predicted nucleic acid-binding protein
MVLADTSVWIDHFRSGEARLSQLLDRQQIVAHEFVIGELALGSLRQRDVVIGALRHLPRAIKASDDEVLQFIERYSLHGLGIGFIDAHLLASTKLTPDTVIWTRDKLLTKLATKLNIDAAIA